MIDVYSCFIVGWSLHNSLDASYCIEVLQNAIATYENIWIERFWLIIKYEYIYTLPEDVRQLD